MSLNRYLSNQVGQSPEDYVGAASPSRSKAAKPHDTGDPCDVESYYYDPNYCAQQGGTPYDSGQQGTGADTQDPCDQASAYYDPNYCQQYGGQVYNSQQGSPTSSPGNPYATGSPGSQQPTDYSFCDSLVVDVWTAAGKANIPQSSMLLLPPPLHVQGAQGDQLFQQQMAAYYNNLTNAKVMIYVTAPNGTFNIPFKMYQVTSTGNPYDDFYTDGQHRYLLFADASSQEFNNAGIAQFCPSYAGGPTGQCQDIPGYQCQMSGDAIMMGEFLKSASPVTRLLANKKLPRKPSAPASSSSSSASASHHYTWRKMTQQEKAAQQARYRAGGNSRASQKGVPLSKVSTVSRPLAKSTSQRSRIPSKANRINRAVPSQAKTRILPYSANLPGTAVSGAAFQRKTGTPPYFPTPRKPPRGTVMGAPTPPTRPITCVIRGQKIYCNGKRDRRFLAP